MNKLPSPVVYPIEPITLRAVNTVLANLLLFAIVAPVGAACLALHRGNEMCVELEAEAARKAETTTPAPILQERSRLAAHEF